MSEAQAAIGLDRLPWLPDEPPARRRAGAFLPFAIAGTMAVAAASYWLGVKTSVPPASAPAVMPIGDTVPLPAPRPADALTAPTPQRVEPIEPMVAPALRVEQSAPEPVIIHRVIVQRVPAKPLHTDPEDESELSKVESAQSAEPAKVAAPTPQAVQIWPVRALDGASGRLVRIGTFRTAHQAKRGWWAIMKVNPALKRLPALVVPVRSLRNGQVYYRLQMGTTSQAHSAVLCQRMRMIAQSCVVIGLNGAAGEVAL